MTHRWLAIAGWMMGCGCAGATTWSEQMIPDPFAEKAECTVQAPMSSGSYIYQWPEKFDQVFWPLTDPMGIWQCPTSGFVAMIGDMEKLTDPEKQRIAEYLAENPAPKDPADLGKTLDRLEAIYALRDVDFRRKITLLGAWAYLSETNANDQARADRLRRQALGLIREAMQGELDQGAYLQYLFVASNYERHFGNTKQADADLAELEEIFEAGPDGVVEDYANYLKELLPEARKIKPGGRLAPSGTDD